MALELTLTGKIIKVLNLVTGEGKNGPWKKQEFVIEFTDGQFPRKVCLSTWGEKVDTLNKFKIGDTVTASFNLESREYNERWFTEARAWKIVNADASQSSNSQYQQEGSGSSLPYSPEPLPTATEASDDLPF